MSWWRVDGQDVVVQLHIQPGARKTEVTGLHGEALKIRLAAPPVDGRANDCLLAFVAEQLGITRSRVELLSGAASRAKRLRLYGMASEAARVEACLLA